MPRGDAAHTGAAISPYGDAPPTTDLRLQRSSRDAASVPQLLADWLATQLPAGAEPQVSLHSGIHANGMSSETLVFDVTWREDGEQRTHSYVARVQPAEADLPVFASYDLTAQREAIRLVGELSDVPVPAVGPAEPTGAVLGTPFFLMDRVEGIVPPDIPPYVFGDNWVYDAPRASQRALQDATVAAIAGLHAIPDPMRTFAFLDKPGEGTAMQRNLAWVRRWYEFAVPDIGHSPSTERALAWLAEHMPSAQEQGEPVLCWGDARIGNVLYRDFAPVAVLDWELATLGPRALDLSWLVFAHRVFQTIVGVFELDGMPHFLTEDDVRATYAELTGVEVGDLLWYHVYHAVQWSIVFMRTGARSVRFGEIERPDDIETLMHHKPLLDQLFTEAGI